MILRAFKEDDAQIIAAWIRSEEELYKWSADRFNKYPLSGDDINENYAPQLETGRFYPMTAVDDTGEVSGHFIIRYPREDDDSSVRFGFIIVNPDIRGKGYGKEMLRLGIEYVKKNLGATRIDLGVFDNNESARHCYEAVGFTEYARRKCELPIGIWSCSDLEIFIKKTKEECLPEKFLVLDHTYLAEMADLYKSAFYGKPWNDDWSDREQLMEYVREKSGGLHALNYGLIIDRKLVAISLGQITHWWEGTNYVLDELCVSPDCQGTGIGTRFMELIEADLKTRDVKGIFLQTDSDKPAYRFYQKNGFKDLSRHVSLFKGI
ncbi:MAG: GNAT family N-acetyltransferase [Eubacterium sp.]|nr:GNAT family N-acetyltransferase [Eubacterium sp.]